MDIFSVLFGKKSGASPEDLQPLLDAKADKTDTVITGSLSMGRAEGSTIGANSVALGSGCTASKQYAHAEGMNTTASGLRGAHAEGENTTASGPRGAHAEGKGTTASGESSHAEGGVTTAAGERSHAEGFFNSANGKCSHSEGSFNSAIGDYSHVEGYENNANGKYQHVQGKFAKDDLDNRYAHIVGNGRFADEEQGETEDVHSNAHTLDWDGNAWFAGNVKVGGTDYDTATALLTQADVPPRVEVRFNVLPNGDVSNASITSSAAFADLCTEISEYVTGEDPNAVLPDVRILAASGGEQKVYYYQPQTVISDGVSLIRIIGSNSDVAEAFKTVLISWNGTNVSVGFGS